MKMFVKATALVLAASVFLTGCSDIDTQKLADAAKTAQSERAVKDAQTERDKAIAEAQKRAEKAQEELDKEYEVYTNASITQVEDQEYTVGYQTGTYTGDWKGNRPEGNGTLVISENEYYSGEWKYGYVSGQGEIKTIGDDGVIRHYQGECEYNQPSGRGQMIICDSETGNKILADGDFNAPDTLLLYTLDANGKLLDIGGYVNNEFVSLVDNPNIKLTPIENFFSDRGTAGSVNYYKFRQSYYIGQVNEKGLPDGYGYYAEEYEYNDSHTYKAIGSWKNGKMQGFFTEETVDWGSKVTSKTGFWGREEYTETFRNTVKLEGYISGNRLSGSYEKYAKYETSPSKATDGVFITIFDASTSTETTGKHLPDGTHHFEILHKTGATTYDQGQYYKFDKNEELTIHKEFQNGSWVTLMDTEKVREEARQRLGEIGGYVLFGGIFIGVLALVCSSNDHDKLIAWKDSKVAQTNANVADYQSNMAIRSELLDERRRVLEEASRESGYRRSQLLEEADRLEREAESHYRSLI